MAQEGCIEDQISSKVANLTTDDSGDVINGASVEEDDDIVNPWDVASKSAAGVDYDKLIKKFGCSKIDDFLISRLEKMSGGKPAHHFLKRGIFFSHREFGRILGKLAILVTTSICLIVTLITYCLLPYRQGRNW